MVILCSLQGGAVVADVHKRKVSSPPRGGKSCPVPPTGPDDLLPDVPQPAPPPAQRAQPQLSAQGARREQQERTSVLRGRGPPPLRPGGKRERGRGAGEGEGPPPFELVRERPGNEREECRGEEREQLPESAQ